MSEYKVRDLCQCTFYISGDNISFYCEYSFIYLFKPQKLLPFVVYSFDIDPIQNCTYIYDCNMWNIFFIDIDRRRNMKRNIKKNNK